MPVRRPSGALPFARSKSSPVSARPPIDVVRNHALFAELRPNDESALVRALRLVRTGPNGVLYRQGDAAQTIYVLEAGSVRLGHIMPDGYESTASILSPGDVFGDEGLFDEHATRVTDAVLITEAAIYGCPARVVRRIIETNVRTASNVARHFQLKHHHALASVQRIAMLPVRERILEMLEHFDVSHGTRKPDGGVRINIRLTHTQIAVLIGSARETVTTEIAHLVRSQRLRVEDGYFTLPPHRAVPAVLGRKRSRFRALLATTGPGSTRSAAPAEPSRHIK